MSNQIQSIPFHGDMIEAAPNGRTWVASLKRLCENLGVDYASQYTKLKSKKWATIVFNTTVGSDGKNREMVMIDRRTFTMWLANIEPSRVREELRPKIEAYQCEAADALDEYFNEGAAIRLEEGDTEDAIIAKGMLAAGRKIEVLKQQLEQANSEVVKRGRQLDAAHENLASLGRQLDMQKPYAAIGAEFVQMDGTVSIKKVYRNFQALDESMSMSHVFQLLRDNGYIEKRSKAPTQKATKPGYLKQKIGQKRDGKMAEPYAVFTAKGIGWFISRFIYGQQQSQLDMPTIY